ncbi:MAG: subclass B1 metallo-beta-lactamase [Candidatus Marinimicrobia bacterium]|nr:subclass B1 metallo-beta-lactamase [Candidatus Neomarinimicrobiota bacterium]
MKLKFIIIITVLSGLFCSTTPAQNSDQVTISEDIQLIHLTDSVFVHVTWENSEQYGRFPSNGLIIIKNGAAVMVDTPMDNEKTRILTEYVEHRFNVKMVKLIIGHYHNDCMGGLEYIQTRGIESVANAMTIDKCRELNLPLPSVGFSDSFEVDIHGEKIICRYFGGGHTFDNITVWLPEQKILFGGCLVRSWNSQGLGNIGDAVVNEWDATITKVLQTYPKAEYVIPGHGDPGDRALLAHTLKLVTLHKQRHSE